MGRPTADVVVFLNIPKVLTYTVPDGMAPHPGCRVAVPVRNTTQVGVVIGVAGDGRAPGPLKDIEAVLDEEPLLTGEILELVKWTARYYHAGIGPCMALAFPPALRRPRVVDVEDDPVLVRGAHADMRLGRVQRGLLDAVGDGGLSMSELRKLFPGSSATIRGLLDRGLLAVKNVTAPHAPAPSSAPSHSPEQRSSIARVRGAIQAGGFHVFVLHGITGSGKTEVYLTCALEALERGRSVLYLVPEIALTSQTVAMIKGRIPCEIAVFHSGLAEVERAREFLRVARRGVRFVLGTRSAVFAPLKDLGLIVVDEEHDHSYKQDEGVHYNARDLSVVRAARGGACVILGSATPSMETFEHARSGRYELLAMNTRVGAAALPVIRLVDMRSVKKALSDELLEEMGGTLARGEQVLLFINRRGFSSALVCPGCGRVLGCTRCTRSLTYHRGRGEALCHWCGFSMRLPEICPSCGCLDMKPLGFGTERVLHEVRDAFPGARVMRMDSDEMTTPRKIASALDAIRDRAVDIVVGTQMIAKGHDFPHLTLVGVVHAEQILHMPDFRSGERMFQQIVQVAGRAGRRRPDTLVVIQTLIPEHPLMSAVVGHDYHAMARIESDTRRAAGFPPYVHLARCVVTAQTENLARDVVERAALELGVPGVEVLGPAPAPVAVVRNRHRWHLLVRSAHRGRLHAALDRIEGFAAAGAQIRIDVDPYSML